MIVQSITVSLVLASLAVYGWSLFKAPKCPNCGARKWSKERSQAWQCTTCLRWYDAWRKVQLPAWRYQPTVTGRSLSTPNCHWERLPVKRIRQGVRDKSITTHVINVDMADIERRVLRGMVEYGL